MPDPNPLAFLLDLQVAIRDRDALSRVRRADMVRVLTVRGWHEAGDIGDGSAQRWIKPGAKDTDWTEPIVYVPVDQVADRASRVGDTIRDIARVEGVGPLRVLVELLAGTEAAPPAAGVPEEEATHDAD